MQGIDLIYDEIFDLLLENKFLECDIFIENFLKSNPSLKLQVALLTITKPFKEKLKNRDQVYNTLKSIIYQERSEKTANNILDTFK